MKKDKQLSTVRAAISWLFITLKAGDRREIRDARELVRIELMIHGNLNEVKA